MYWLYTANLGKTRSFTSLDMEDCRWTGATPLSTPACRYHVWQLEKAPTTGMFHYQGYCVFHKVLSMRQAADYINNMWAMRGIHVESRYEFGTHEKAKAYCSKTDTRVRGPWMQGSETGIPLGPGTRPDLASLADDLIAGKTLALVMRERPDIYVRYHSGFKALVNDLLTAHRGRRAVTWRYGASGSGKTARAYHCHPHLYRVMAFGSTIWFDGYRGETTVLLDDLQPAPLSWTALMEMMDSRAHRIPIKGGSMWATFRRVQVCTVPSPLEWLREGPFLHKWEELRRRLTTIVCHAHVVDPDNASNVIHIQQTMRWTPATPSNVYGALVPTQLE